MCFICEESLSEGEITLVKERGVNRLREASVKREIHAHSLLLTKLKEVRVPLNAKSSVTMKD